MRILTAISTFLLMLLPLAAGTGFGQNRTVAVLPFYDDSGYEGPWQLRYEIPVMLGDMLQDNTFNVVPMDTVRAYMPPPPHRGWFRKFIDVFRSAPEYQRLYSDLEVVAIARQLGADYAISGIIDDFSFHRTGGGDMLLGSYKSYTSHVLLSSVRVLRVSDAAPLGTINGEAENNTRGLGLELFGKPRDMDLEFYSLDTLDFGSRGYLETMMGMTTVEALNNAQKEIRAIIALPDSGWNAGKQYKVVSVDGGIVHINAGSADGIGPGDRFRVFAAESGVLVGKVNVTSIWSDHLANAEILEGQDTIRAEDIIMPE